jgi:glyoxylase-like metal-dependent hydrolase (beta-lactamase superfamily II)
MKTGSTMLLAAFLFVQNPQAPPAPPMTVDKIANDLYVVRGEGGNTSVYLTDEGVILVDPKFERNHDELIAKVTALSNKPIKYVFNTHPHGDHTGGNLKLLPTTIIGHKNVSVDMIKGKLPGPPQVTFGDEIRVSSGGKEAVAYHYGRCHTDGDSFIYFPALKVLAAGDCITSGNGQGVPNPPNSTRINIDYNNGGSITEAVKTVDQLLKLDFDTVVPGHGPLIKKADIVRWHAGLQRLRTRVSAVLREGKGKQDVSDVLVKEFEWDAAGNPLRNVLDGLIAELKP